MTMQPVQQYPTPRILVADPDGDVRALYHRSFVEAGCDVVEAVDGREAMERAFTRAPVLVITELSLPLVDGYALCEILRSDRTTSDVPILVVTAEGAPEALARARSAGADAVLRKPASRDEILREMRRLTAHARELQHRSANASAAAAEQMRKSAELITRSEKSRRRFPAKAHRPEAAPAVETRPPALLCPSCARPLAFVASVAGDDSGDRRDRFVCLNHCGTFEYRWQSKELTQVA